MKRPLQVGDRRRREAMRFRTKACEIDAIQYTVENLDEVLKYAEPHAIFVEHLYIRTLEGDMLVSKGDWVVRGLEGEFYPCKPSPFHKKYEAADAAPLMTPDRFDAKARELMESLTAINSHLGYQFTQPLMFAKEHIAQALRDADQAGYRRAIQDVVANRDELDSLIERYC